MNRRAQNGIVAPLAVQTEQTKQTRASGRLDDCAELWHNSSGLIQPNRMCCFFTTLLPFDDILKDFIMIFPPDNPNNILSSLLPSEALKLRKKIASEWNAKRTQKQKDEDIFYTIEDVKEASIEDVVRYSDAKKISAKALKYRVSKRIEVAAKINTITLVCKNTGINSRLDIPRIPGFYMSYENPLSDISNCRDIVKRGFGYLSALDTQVLAGMLIIIAEDYNLFRFSPAETGASKNSILRSCGKTELIKALLFIEEKIHSENYAYLPQLSFQIDSFLVQGTMEARLSNWLRIIQKELETPTIVFEAPATKISGGYIKVADVKKAAMQESKAQRKANLELKKQLLEAIANVKGLYKDALISQKLKNFLISTLDYSLFCALDMTTKVKISLKLCTLPIESRISSLVALFDKDIKTKEIDLDDFSAPTIEEEKQVKMKTAFELQNSAIVIEAQRAEYRAMKALEKLVKQKNAFIQTMLAPVSYNTQLLLSFDSTVSSGYDDILLTHKPIPKARIRSIEVQKAYDLVSNWKAPTPIVEDTKEEENVDMTDIGDGLQAPTLLWNSMSIVKQAVYKRKLLASKV